MGWEAFLISRPANHSLAHEKYMALTRLKLENFTAFESLDMELSPGINVLVGANGTGKTHIMKVCYAACVVSKSDELSYPEKLARVFLPSGRLSDRLARRGAGSGGVSAEVQVNRGSEKYIGARFAAESKGIQFGPIPRGLWQDSPIESVYIPVKEMLANAPGFRSLYALREIHFEEVYKDVLDHAYLPPLRNPKHKHLLGKLQDSIGGEVVIKGEEFFLNTEHGLLEFTLLAEGFRKLGLLWLLIRNGSLQKGSVLFWDEPETNLNPKLLGTVIEVLLELQRSGVQIFLATHNYAVLEEIYLHQSEEDEVAFHSLYRDGETGEIACNTTFHYLGIHPNPIAEAWDSIYDRMIERNLGDIGR